MKEKAFLSLVVYVHNNTTAVSSFLITLDSFLHEKFENYEIIVVDDASTDSSREEIVRTSGVMSRGVMLVSLAWKHGPEKGTLAGIDMAIGDFVVELDLNKNDYEISIIHDLFEQTTKGFDIVGATPTGRRGILNSIFLSLFNRLSYLTFDVTDESIRIVSRRAINAVLTMDEYVINRGILYQLSGFPHTIIHYSPVAERPASGLSSFREKLRTMVDVTVAYSNIGSNLSVILSLIFLFLSIFIALYALTRYFFVSGILPGWTTTILFFTVCFFGVFLILGIQGRYISSILRENKRRSNYVVKKVDRLSRQGP